MTHPEYLLWGQVGLEALLLGVLGWYLVRTRHLSRSLSTLTAPDSPLASRKALLEQRLADLEKRLRLLEEALQPVRERWAGPPGVRGSPVSDQRRTGASLRSQVEGLSRQGLAPEEIARHLGLQVAEVKVALDLARCRPA